MSETLHIVLPRPVHEHLNEAIVCSVVALLFQTDSYNVSKSRHTESQNSVNTNLHAAAVHIDLITLEL